MRCLHEKHTQARKIEELLGDLQAGDLLLTSELSRLGRSVGQIIQIVATLIKNQVQLVAVKESININGKNRFKPKRDDYYVCFVCRNRA